MDDVNSISISEIDIDVCYIYILLITFVYILHLEFSIAFCMSVSYNEYCDTLSDFSKYVFKKLHTSYMMDVQKEYFYVLEKHFSCIPYKTLSFSKGLNFYLIRSL